MWFNSIAGLQQGCATNNVLFRVQLQSQQLPIYTLYCSSPSRELNIENVNIKLHDSNSAVCVCVFWKNLQKLSPPTGMQQRRVDTTLSPLGSSTAGRNLMDIIASKSELVFTAVWAGRAKIAAWLEQGERECIDGYRGPLRCLGPPRAPCRPWSAHRRAQLGQ